MTTTNNNLNQYGLNRGFMKHMISIYMDHNVPDKDVLNHRVKNLMHDTMRRVMKEYIEYHMTEPLSNGYINDYIEKLKRECYQERQHRQEAEYRRLQVQMKELGVTIDTDYLREELKKTWTVNSESSMLGKFMNGGMHNTNIPTKPFRDSVDAFRNSTNACIQGMEVPKEDKGNGRK